MPERPASDQHDESMPDSTNATQSAQMKVLIARRASNIAWAVGAVEMIFTTMMAAFLFWAAGRPIDELYRSYFHESLAYSDWQVIHPRLGGFAIAVLLLGLLPGVVYLVAGYSLRRSIAKAGLFVATLAILQCFVLASLLVTRLALAFGHGDPSAMSMSVLAIGTPIAVLLYTARCSWAVWRLRYRT